MAFHDIAYEPSWWRLLAQSAARCAEDADYVARALADKAPVPEELYKDASRAITSLEFAAHLASELDI
jgi:hypothetical protein